MIFENWPRPTEKPLLNVWPNMYSVELENLSTRKKVNRILVPLLSSNFGLWNKS